VLTEGVVHGRVSTKQDGWRWKAEPVALAISIEAGALKQFSRTDA
jgi:hypothetical protein